LAVLLSALAGGFPATPAARAADARPPEFMTYQGFLVDANGQPLAPNNPANYPVIFRIYDQATGGTKLWAEQQIVTIDKGNFSVLLGEGTEVSGEARPPLSTVFGGSGLAANASDRYLGVTVTISGTPTEILPRLRLLPAPYAYLARHANALVDGNGQPLVAAGTGNNLVVAGNVTANAFVGNGASLTGLDAGNVTSGVLADARIPGLNASKITAGVLAADRIPGLDASKITAGTLADARLSGNVARRDVTNTFATGMQINGHLRLGEVVNTTTPGTKGYGKALIFSGAPDVSGFWNSDNSDPLWIARFNDADNNTQLRINIGDDPGGGDALVIGTTSGAGADFNQTGTWTPRVTIDSAGTVRANSFTTTSSRRYKENITPLKDDFALLLKAQAMTYTRPGNPDRWEIGYIAEDFHDLGLTRLVDYDREGHPDGIKYEKICLYLNENAKQQARELAELKARYQAQAEVVSAQQRELDELKNRLRSLEQLLRQVAAAAGGLPSGAAVAAAAAPLSGEAAR
jgi:hypothetical protein